MEILKRAVSFALCIAFVFTLNPFLAFADTETSTETDITSDTVTNESTASPVICSECSGIGIHFDTCSQFTPTSDTSEEALTTFGTTNASSSSVMYSSNTIDTSYVPVCNSNCGTDVLVSAHNDSCDVKIYYKGLYDNYSAEALYSAWKDLPADAQDYILNSYSWNDQTKRAELVSLIENGSSSFDEEAEETFVSYTPTYQPITNVTVNAYAAEGILAEGAQISLTNTNFTDASLLFSAISSISGLDDITILDYYAMDISFLLDNTKVQPNGSVYLNFDIPSTALAVNGMTSNVVVILHINDFGVAEIMGYQFVDSFEINQNISVEVNSFSTYVVALVNNKYPAKLMSTVFTENPTLDARYDIVTFPVTLNDFDAQQFNNTYGTDGLRFTTGTAGTGMNLGALCATQGIVAVNLSNSGYPITHGTDRGEMIFSPSNTVNGSTVSGKSAHSNVNFQFIYDNQTGYYTYNSGANHAQYNSTNNTVELYSETLAPFNYLTDIKNKITTYSNATKSGTNPMRITVKTKDNNHKFRMDDGSSFDSDNFTHIYLRLKSNFSGKLRCRVYYTPNDYNSGDYDQYEVDLQKDTWADYVFGPFDTGKTVYAIRWYIHDANVGNYVDIQSIGLLKTLNGAEVNFAGLYPFNVNIQDTFAGSDEFSLTDWEYRILNEENARLLSSRVLYNTSSGSSNLTDTYAYFAMAMEVSFYIPVGRKVNGEDIVFHFNGDDDLWVFVDNKLALDIGGAHTDVQGTINFSTGTTYVENVRSLTDTTLTGKGADSGTLDASQFSEGQYHTMKIFYMERAGTNSNCLIKFNLPVVPQGSVEIEKEVAKTVNGTPTALSNDLKNINFEYEIKVDNTILANTSYSVYDSVSNTTTQHTTTNTGRFTIKHGQKAVFNISENKNVTVTEVVPTVTGYVYTATTVNGVSSTSLTQKTLANQTQRFGFVNTYNQQISYLKVKKTVDVIGTTSPDPNTQFMFNVTLTGLEGSDSYYTLNGTSTQIPITNNTISINLKANEYADFTIVGASPSYTVKEVGIISNNSEYWTLDTTERSGSTVIGEVTLIEIINTYSESYFDLTIEKNAGIDTEISDDETFLFNIYSGSDLITPYKTVIISGTGSVTITNLLEGIYTVVEDTNWSWRYKDVSVQVDSNAPQTSNTATVELQADTTVKFTNTLTETQWIDDSTYAENTFTDGTLSN